MRKWIIAFSCIIIAALAIIFFTSGSKELTVEQRKCIDAAYQKCQLAVEKEAAALEKWYLSRCGEHTKRAADSLAGWTAKRKIMFLSKEELAQYTKEVLDKEVFSEADCQKKIVSAIAHVSKSWLDAEDELSIQTDCFELSSKAKAEKIRASGMSIPNNDLRGQVIRSLQTEGVSLVAGELAAQIAVQMATSAGILGTGAALSWETFGIGLVVGVVGGSMMNIIHDNWIMDPAGKVQDQLDAQIRKTAAAQKKLFRESLMKALEARRWEWIDQISKS